MSNILLQFPAPPCSGLVTALEQEGVMRAVSDSRPYSIPDYPDISLQTNAISSHNSRLDSAQMAFLTHGHSVWKRASHSWSRSGLIGLLKEICDSPNEVPPWVSQVCHTFLRCAHKVIYLKEALFPQMGLSTVDLVEKFSHVSNWQHSPVCALSWHPHITKLAMALKDDTVHVYGSQSGVTPVLRHKLQKEVADLAWQPLSASVLAVACQTCVLIWHVEPMSLAVRPASSTVQILQSPGHSPVTSLAWNPDSSHLVTASPKQPAILVWDVPREKFIPLKRGGTGGVALLQYSPDSSKLFTGTTAPLFRVWETQTWHAEVWSQLSGFCTAAAWSPDGTILVFAMSGQRALYAVRHSEGELSAVGTSVLLANVDSLTLRDTEGKQLRTGGSVKSIVWDSTGERLAVLFEGTESGSNPLVAVFKATLHPVLQLLPGGFVRGRSGEDAHHIAFQPNYKKGALLSVVWSSGRVGYVPMHFVSVQEIREVGPPGIGNQASRLAL